MSRIADDFLAKRPELLEKDFRWRPLLRFASFLGALMVPYFRFRGVGTERVPAGGCLVVANHSCAAPWEILLVHRWWRRTFGDRPARGLMHRIAFDYPLKLFPLGPWMGGVLAHPEVARRVLARGEALLVFPGGDVDSCRSFLERYEVHFGSRSGFARTAREANVPIVPLAITGAHAAYVLPPGLTRLASFLGTERLLGLKALPVSVGLVLFLGAAIATLIDHALWPLAVGTFTQMFVPLPTRIEAEFLEPIVPGEGETDAQVAERVRRAIEEAVARRAEKQAHAVGVISALHRPGRGRP